jgi:aminoglycoside/choline kinase family phosphotransferase
MSNENQEQLLSRFFKQLTGAAPTTITELRPHASERRIFRLVSGHTSIIGALNPIRRENDSFVNFARFFFSRGLPVPEIYLYEPDYNLILERDLGDQTLFDRLSEERSKSSGSQFPDNAEALYIKSLTLLPRFQIECAKDFNFAQCYPERDLLPGTFAGDCAAFAKELVLRLLPDFDLAPLTKDFAELITFLERADASSFVYRDFQSRNIMIVEDAPFFIDFQSGRRGALQYDVVSLLYQSSTKIPDANRSKLVEHYIEAASKYAPIDRELFHHFYSGFIIARMLQVLGVYGRQGLGAGKSYFTDSIPGALATLNTELNKKELPISLPRIRECVTRLLEVKI